MKSRLLGAVSCLLALNVNATVIYTYTGKNFNSFIGSAFDDSMNVTGYMELAELLAPNLVNANAFPLSYSFTDGVSTITNDDATLAGDTFRFYTDLGGTIFMWRVSMRTEMPDPAQIRTRHEQTFFASQTLDFGRFWTPSSVDAGEVHNQRGRWAVVPTPVPEPSTLALLGIGMAGLIFVKQRKEQQAGSSVVEQR